MGNSGIGLEAEDLLGTRNLLVPFLDAFDGFRGGFCGCLPSLFGSFLEPPSFFGSFLFPPCGLQGVLGRIVDRQQKLVVSERISILRLGFRACANATNPLHNSQILSKLPCNAYGLGNSPDL